MDWSVWIFPPTLGGETELLSPPIQIWISPTLSWTDTPREGEYLPDKWLPVIQLNYHITLTTATSFGIPNISEPQRFCLSHRIKYFMLGKTLATRMLGGEERLMWQTDLEHSTKLLCAWFRATNRPQNYHRIALSLECYLWLTYWFTGMECKAPQPQVYKTASWFCVTIMWFSPDLS